MTRPSAGLVYVIAVVQIAALGSVQSPVTVAGFRYTGWIWVSLIVFGLFLVLGTKTRPSFPLGIWAIWFGCVWVSLLWAGGIDAINVQEAIQITMPLLVGVVASLHVRDRRQLRVLRLSTIPALAIMVVAFLALRHGPIGPFSVALRTLAITACLFGCVFVAAASDEGRRSFAGWAVCLTLAFLSASRMATFALLLVWLLHPPRRNAFSRLSLGLLVAGLGVAMFHSPVFQERFFGAEGGSFARILRGDFSTAGRFEIWPFIWEEAQRHPVRGSGVGGVQRLLMDTRPVWYGINKAHNDYLRIFFEQGAIGISCFAASILLQLRALRQRMRRATGELRFALSGAYLGLVLLLLIMITDNIILYNTWYMNPLFAILGAAYGVEHRERPRRTVPHG